MVTRMYQKNKFTLIPHLGWQSQCTYTLLNKTYGIFPHVQNEGRKLASSILLPFPSSLLSPTTIPSLGTVMLHMHMFVPLGTVAASETVRENNQGNEKNGTAGMASTHPWSCLLTAKREPYWIITIKKHHSGPWVGNLSWRGMIFSMIQRLRIKDKWTSVHFLIVSLLQE